MGTRKNDQNKQSTNSTKDSKKIQIGSRSPAFGNDTKDKKKIRIGSRSPAFG